MSELEVPEEVIERAAREQHRLQAGITNYGVPWESEVEGEKQEQRVCAGAAIRAAVEAVACFLCYGRGEVARVERDEQGLRRWVDGPCGSCRGTGSLLRWREGTNGK